MENVGFPKAIGSNEAGIRKKLADTRIPPAGEYIVFSQNYKLANSGEVGTEDITRMSYWPGITIPGVLQENGESKDVKVMFNSGYLRTLKGGVKLGANMYSRSDLIHGDNATVRSDPLYILTRKVGKIGNFAKEKEKLGELADKEGYALAWITPFGNDTSDRDGYVSGISILPEDSIREAEEAMVDSEKFIGFLKTMYPADLMTHFEAGLKNQKRVLTKSVDVYLDEIYKERVRKEAEEKEEKRKAEVKEVKVVPKENKPESKKAPSKKKGYFSRLFG